jgi:signal transduction histidine kinase
MWYGVQIAAYVSLIVGYALLLLLAVRHRRQRGRPQRLLEIVLLLAGLWVIGLGALAFIAFGAWQVFAWQRSAEAGLVVLALLTAEFADAYVNHPARLWLWRAIVAIPVLIAFALEMVPLSWLSLPFVAALPLQRTALAGLLLAFAWGISSGRAWKTAVSASRRAAGSKHRNRIRYLLVGLVGFAVGDLLVLVGGIPDVYVGLAARLLGFSIVTFALLRYDLPDVERFSRASLCFAVLTGLTSFLYLGVLFGLVRVTGVFADASRSLVAVPVLVLGLVVATGVDLLLRPRLRHLLDRIVMGQTYDVQTALRAYSQQTSLILDLERLADTTLDWLQTTLQVQRAAFVLFTPRGDDEVELRILQATTEDPPPAQVFHAASRFILHFHNVRRPLSQYDVDMLSWFENMPADERQWLRDLSMDLYIPILVAGKPAALLALGPKAGKGTYSAQDNETLMILAGQVATALENARLVDDLRAVQDDLHRLSTQLAETNQQLQRLDKTKSDFITIASHELRTPLTQIYGYSDILTRMQADDLSDAQVVQQFIEGITRGASRLKRVVDAIIDVSLIEIGALKIYPTSLPVGLVVENAVETVRQAAGQRCLDFDIQDFAHLPYIQADSARLEQAFVSVLSNAVKFTPDGGRIAVSGSAGSLSSADAFIELKFADSGIGIDPDQRDLIFEKFHRAENILHHSTDDIGFKGAGPGLGLSIAKGIVEAHGGRIWVESPCRDEERCPGSTFHIRLPVNSGKQGTDHG